MNKQIHKTLDFTGFYGCYWMVVNKELVEAAGVEPASVDPPLQALHA